MVESGILKAVEGLNYGVTPIADLPAQLTRRAFRAINALVVPMLDLGVGNPLPIGMGAVVVETTGRVSGKPRRVPVMSLRCGDQLFVSTFRSGSQWFANLEAEPTARVHLHGKDRPARVSLSRGALNVAVLDVA